MILAFKGGAIPLSHNLSVSGFVRQGHLHCSVSAFVQCAVHMCLELASWGWITYQGLIPGEDWFSLSSHELPVALHLGGRYCEISPIYIGCWCCHFSGLVRWPYRWDIMGQLPCHIQKTLSHNRHANPLVLNIFSPPLLRYPWALGIGVVLLMYHLGLDITASCFLHFDKFRIYVMMPVWWKGSFFVETW